MHLCWNLNPRSPEAAEAERPGDRDWRARSAAGPSTRARGSAGKDRVAKTFSPSAGATAPTIETVGPAAFRALILHDIAAENLGKFERLVHSLLATRRIIAPADVRSLLLATAGASNRAPCLLTFDDGFLSQYRVARDILDPYGVKAAFFVCPGLIDLAERGDYTRIAKCLGFAERERMRPLMGWREVEALARNGHTIGAHSETHRRLVNLTAETLEEEVLSCGNRLELSLAAPVEWFAYPFGDIRSIDECALRCVTSRYTHCYSGVRGLNRASAPPSTMLRDHLDLHAPFSYLRIVLEGALDWRYIIARRQLRRIAGRALSQGKE